MTTATVIRKLVERPATELYKFTNNGEQIEGVLVAINKVEIEDADTKKMRPVIEYVLQMENKKVKFLGTWDLNDKLGRGDLGRFIVVTYLGEDKNVVKNGNHMKRYKVEVDEQTKKRDDLTITDADIPF
jgi:hypothetical protein